VEPQLHPKALLEARREVAAIQLDQRLVDYIVDLVRTTREPNPLVAFGASPRASIALAQASRAMAYLRGRRFVVPEDVQAVAPDVMRHRIVLTFEAEAEDVTTDTIVQKVVASVRAP
jgi:MoxR-like ATPase